MLLITASLILIHRVWVDFANLKAKTRMAFQVFLSAIIIYVTDIKLKIFANRFFWIGYFANRKSYRKQLSSPKFSSLSNIVFVLLIYKSL